MNRPANFGLGFRIALAALIITIIWAIWFIWHSNSPQVIQASKNVEVYDQLPADFPSGLWADKNAAPEHVDIATDGGEKTETVIYQTLGALPVVMGLVQTNLQKAGWTVGQTKISSDSGFIIAADGSENMAVTFTAISNDIQATFQYMH